MRSPTSTKRNVADTTFVTKRRDHGLSVAGVHVCARSVVYLSLLYLKHLLKSSGFRGQVCIGDYEASMTAAAKAAIANNWVLLSDSSWRTARIAASADGRLSSDGCRTVKQMKSPAHIFLQAGVGGSAKGCGTSGQPGQHAITVVEHRPHRLFTMQFRLKL